ncbi:MAG TPA: hypothetical protein VHU82_02715, partial [Vicinamibacterales bacterium]|nr:hypothetical protein [Vicinamibacterales bacterium]
VDAALDGQAPPLTQARIRVRLTDGRELSAAANGARGYPEHPASEEELAAKFLACAERQVPRERAVEALEMLSAIERLENVRSLAGILAVPDPVRAGR